MRAALAILVLATFAACESTGERTETPDTDRNPAGTVSAPQSRSLGVSGGMGGVIQDLRLDVSGDQEGASRGGYLSYTFTLRNEGPESAGLVVLEVPLPSELDFVAGEGPSNPTLPADGGRRVRFEPGVPLPSGESVIWRLTLQGARSGSGSVTAHVYEGVHGNGPLKVSVPFRVN